MARVRRVCTCCTHHAALASPVVPAVFAGRTLWTGWLNVASSHRCEPSNSGCIFSESYAHQPVSHIAQAQVSESATVATLERPKTRARGKTGLNLLSLSLCFIEPERFFRLARFILICLSRPGPNNIVPTLYKLSTPLEDACESMWNLPKIIAHI